LKNSQAHHFLTSQSMLYLLNNIVPNMFCNAQKNN